MIGCFIYESETSVRDWASSFGQGRDKVREECILLLLSQVTLFARASLKWKKLYVKALFLFYGDLAPNQDIAQCSTFEGDGCIELQLV